MPGQSTTGDGPIDAAASNPGTQPVSVQSATAVVLINGQPAPAGYFTLGSNIETLPKTIQPGSNDNVYQSSLTFNNLPQDQSDVAGKAITVQVTVH